jgi:gas vesicle structural protein
MTRRVPRKPPLPAASLPRRAQHPHLPQRPATARPIPRKMVGRILEEQEASLLDVIDNLLNKGVVLSADIVLALADVDLVYIRLAALICAADRVLPRRPGK